MLNIIWSFFFISAFLGATYQCFFIGNTQIWTDLVNATFSSAKLSFEIALNLTGLLCLWLGLLKIAEKSGITNIIAKMLYPLFRRIMPEIPKDSPAFGSIVMNIAANVLGLDNAATPMGIKAMEQLQVHNAKKDTASNAQILFMVINSAGVTLIPISILMYRTELGSTNPSAVFIPILLSTLVASITSFLAVAWVQRLNIFNMVVMSYLLGFCLFIGLSAYGFLQLPIDSRAIVSGSVGNFLLIFIITSFIAYGLHKKLNVYDEFVVGAKEGFGIAVSIIPYLVAMLVAISLFRESGILDLLILLIENMVSLWGVNTDFVPALPTAIIKPLSGSGARAMMIETMNNYGADSFEGFVASIVQGTTETTFYVLAVYFGAVKISKTRQALPCALFGDFCGIIAAIFLSYLFY